MKIWQILLLAMTVTAAVALELDFSQEIRQNQLKYRADDTVIILYDLENKQTVVATPNADLLVFNLGILIRPVIVDEAIRQKLVNWDNRINCGYGIYTVDGRTMRDRAPAGFLSVAQLLTEYSNIGTYKLARRIGLAALQQRLEAFGIKAGKDLFGVSVGWDVSVNADQVVRLYGALDPETLKRLPAPYLASNTIDANIDSKQYFPRAVGMVNFLGVKHLLFIGVVNPKPVNRASLVVAPLWHVIAAELERQKEQ